LRDYDVRPVAPMLQATSFSGGNQQKLVLAREMEHDPTCSSWASRPGRVDIGAIEFIHKRLILMRDAGKAILLVSVELDEILSLSDRIIVMFDGMITGELPGPDATARRIGMLMAGIREEAA
jgi:simple sugar transport system ATP-binding protein